MIIVCTDQSIDAGTSTASTSVVCQSNRMTSVARSRKNPIRMAFPFLTTSQDTAHSVRTFSSSSRRSAGKSDKLSHIDSKTGLPSMVSVSNKSSTVRSATAIGYIHLNKLAFSLIQFSYDSKSGTADDNAVTMPTKKGDVLSISRLAALMATKQTSSLIPLCHPILISHVNVKMTPHAAEDGGRIECLVRVECEGKTGVEMEALMGVSCGLMCVWDMCKAVSGEDMLIEGIKVIEKKGGRSGDWKREK